jgi:heme exporter protein C
MLVRGYVPDPERRAVMSAVFGIVAFLDAPIVFFSIRWWRDLHPSAVIETGGLAPEMRPAFFTCALVFLVLLVYIIRRRLFLESARVELERLERAANLVR